MKSTFCILPWMTLSIYADGSVRFCCIDDYNGRLNLAFTDNQKTRKYLTIREHSLESIINADSLKEIRHNLTRGIIPHSCELCFKEEKQGITSRRLMVNEWFKFILKKKPDLITGDGSMKSPPYGMELRFNTTCNLACRTCGPHYSNRWIPEYKRLSHDLPFVHPYPVHTSSCIEDRALWEQLLSLIPECTYFYIIGGEPMIIKKHWDFLRFLIENNKAHTVILGYDINMSFIPADAFEIWKEFNSVTLGLSIDGVGKRGEYLRYGLQWQDVIKNMKKIKEHNQKNISVILRPSISWLNVYYIDELFRFKDEWLINTILLNYIHIPEYYSPWILPRDIKRNIVRKLGTHIPEQTLLELEEQLLKRPDNPALLHQGMEINKWLDKNRNQDGKQIFPEIFTLLGGF